MVDSYQFRDFEALGVRVSEGIEIQPFSTGQISVCTVPPGERASLAASPLSAPVPARDWTSWTASPPLLSAPSVPWGRSERPEQTEVKDRRMKNEKNSSTLNSQAKLRMHGKAFSASQ